MYISTTRVIACDSMKQTDHLWYINIGSFLREMIASTNDFPGRGHPSWTKSVARIPRRTHTSINKVPQQIVHTIVQAQLQIPPTRRPVITLNACSKTAPKPMRRENPPAVRNSVPCQSPHRQRSCNTADIANAPISAPTHPSSAPPGHEPKVTNTYRWIWCRRKLHNSVIDVDIHGRLEIGGHCHADCRRRMRPIRVAMW